MERTSRLYSGSGPAESLALRQGTAADVRAALLRARGRTLALADAYAAALGPACIVAQAAELNPPLWEIGHVAWFQEWWLARNPMRGVGDAAPADAHRGASVLPGADALYDSARVPHGSRWRLPLPDAAATRDYLATTLEKTLALLADLPPAPTDADLYFFRLVALHEEMHAEAALYMAQALRLPVPQPPDAPSSVQPAVLQLPAGPFEMGGAARGFAFDNELAARTVAVADLEIDAEPVSWRRFLPFVEAGGYEDDRWWSEAGRAWRAQVGPAHPAAIRQVAGAWQRRRGDAWQPLHVDTTALHLNAHEAEAWCRWAGRELPSEAEWECAALTLPGFRWGQAWEWTRSDFVPYPGFRPHPYREYSEPWFGARRVLRGACPATAPALAHARYRNFFEPHRRDVYAGFRSRNLRPGRPPG